MGQSVEHQLVFNFEPSGFLFWREGIPPAGAALMAYTLDEQGNYARRFWCWPMNAWVDGVESPLPEVECKLVQPMTIALNKPAFIYHPSDLRLPNKPQRLAERWTGWHNSRPRVVHYQSWFETLKRILS